MQESLIFYKSYADAIKLLPETEQLKALWAIINHSLDEEEQKIEGLANIVYTMAKPQIEANSKRRTDGVKGGRPANKTSGFEIEKPNVNSNSNVNENYNDNDNVNVNDNVAVDSTVKHTDTSRASPAIITITTPKEKFCFTEKQITEYEQLYPGVDIIKEIQKMQENIDSMKKCNLSSKSLSQFIERWLSRSPGFERGNNKDAIKKNYGSVDPDKFFEKAVQKSMKIDSG